MRTELAGKRIGRWTVIKFSGRVKNNSTWECRCDCGTVKPVLHSALITNSKSCGCLRREMMSTHGAYKSRTYSIWQNMRRRCASINEARYGGRGISVCNRWSEFESFLADMGEAPLGHSIERIDNNGNYEPSNCRWATRCEQARNTSNTVMLTLNGETMCRLDWARRIGISPVSMAKRIRKGWPLARALTEPKRESMQ